MKSNLNWLAFGVLIFSCPVKGQTIASSTGEAAPSPACELHVWPSQGLRSAYHGWIHGGIVDGAVKGREGYPAVPADAMDTARQVALLGQLDLPTLLDLKTYRVIIHDTALESRAIRANLARNAPSASPCYAELMADDVFFQQDIVNGGTLRSSWRFRLFGTDPAPKLVTGTWMSNDLQSFPPKDSAGMAAALNEVQSAYKANVTQFGAFARVQQSKAKGK